MWFKKRDVDEIIPVIKLPVLKIEVPVTESTTAPCSEENTPRLIQDSPASSPEIILLAERVVEARKQTTDSLLKGVLQVMKKIIF